MKIVFFGTSNVALPVLQALHKHFEVVGVVTSPDAIAGRKKELNESPVSVLANELKLKIFKPENVKKNDIFRLELQNLGADIFIVVSYGKILPKEIIEMPKFKTLNVHFSALPKYRGASPLQAALLNGDSETAVCIFVLDEQLDHGPILALQNTIIEPDDNFLSLSTRLAHESAKFIVTILPNYIAGTIIPKPQNEALATKVGIITKTEGKIDWSKTATEIYNRFRAFYPWPGIWTTWNGKKVKVLDCKATNLQMPTNSTNDYKSGTVLENGIVVCGQNTFLQISSLQPEGKSQTAIKDFLNGNPQFIGSYLE